MPNKPEYRNEHLRNALLKLEPTGEDGFEGLLKVTLKAITQIPFRLASGGSQLGLDGKAAFSQDSIGFEGKRYDRPIRRESIIAKIAEAAIRQDSLDLWVLGATTDVSSQIADDARKVAEQNGVSVTVLDWPPDDLPSLGVVLALAQKEVEAFLNAHIDEPALIKLAAKDLKDICDDQSFEAVAERIQDELLEPTIGFAQALKANRVFLRRTLASRQEAIAELGQPLTPLLTDTPNKILPRNDLVEQIKTFLEGKLPERLLVVHGEEGVGKSWLTPLAWLSLQTPPLLVFLTAEDFQSEPTTSNVKDAISSGLMHALGARNSTQQGIWQRKIERWRHQDLEGKPKFILIIDGINQRPNHDWGRLIDRATTEAKSLGGVVAITSRSSFFRYRVSPRLSSPLVEIEVPEWATEERDDILAANAIEVGSLHADVANSLLNPRLLGIATHLLKHSDIRKLNELSVSRLLFEHIRTSEIESPTPQPVAEFVKTLRRHAEEYLSRANKQQRNDLDLFEGDINAVSDGRFFRPLGDDPTRYTLEPHGRTLALGFAVLDSMFTAERNQNDISEALLAVIEPIATLDLTAEIIWAALCVSCTDERCSDSVVEALVLAFTGLQNPDAKLLPAFASLARQKTKPFLNVMRLISLSNQRASNLDWVEEAVWRARDEESSWRIISEEIDIWLSLHSLSPEQKMMSRAGHDSEEKVMAERQQIQAEIDLKLENLSEFEKKLLNQLSLEDGDLSRIHKSALQLIAGKPIAGFARSLLKWSFSSALNSNLWSPDDDFCDLMFFNSIDWVAARDALLAEASPLAADEVSRTGKWAYVTILRSSGHIHDALEAERLAHKLRPPDSRMKSWRRIEDYCSSDPCNPKEETPENIGSTAGKYTELDVSTLSVSRGMTWDDHFFRDARPGLVRFAPSAALAKHKEFGEHVIHRTGISHKMGILELAHHAALIDRETAVQILQSVLAKYQQKPKASGDEWHRFHSQLELIPAFPTLTWSEQMHALFGLDDDDVLVEILQLVKTPNPSEFENLLRTANTDNNELQQYILLAVSSTIKVQATPAIAELVAKLFKSQSRRVRTQAFATMAHWDQCYIDASTAQDLSFAKDVSRANRYEAQCGSLLLLRLSELDVISDTDAIGRISPTIYLHALTRVDDASVQNLADRIELSIDHACGFMANRVAPDIELTAENGFGKVPYFFSIHEWEDDSKGQVAAFERMAESEEQFEARQNRLHREFESFSETLDRENAQIILDEPSFEAMERLVSVDPQRISAWNSKILNLPPEKRPAVHNIALQVATALGDTEPEKAVLLFQAFEGVKPFVRLTSHRAKVPLEMIATWKGAAHPELDALRLARLDKAQSDHALSLEVLAALLAGKQSLLKTYVEHQLAHEEPARVARGLMVVGFSDGELIDATRIDHYANRNGFIANAYEAASYAFDRNQWARHWYELMCTTESAEDFWRYSVLLGKVVDGRVSLWQRDYPKTGKPLEHFGRSVESRVKSRIKKWGDKREKTLFGNKVPDRPILDGNLH